MMIKILILAALMLAVNVYMIPHFNDLESMRFGGMSIVALGFIFGLFQLKANHDWNRRSTALLETEKNKDRYLEALKHIYGLEILDLEHRENAYSVKEIHLAICEIVTSGKLKPKNPTTLEYDMTTEGKLLKKHLFEVFNYYEFLATGVNNGVFDEKIIKPQF